MNDKEDKTNKKAEPQDVFIEEDIEADELPEAFNDMIKMSVRPFEEDSQK